MINEQLNLSRRISRKRQPKLLYDNRRERFSKQSGCGILFSGGRVAASAPDKMDDFNLIAFAQLGFRPRGATHDFAVMFDGEPLGRERKLADEIGQREFVR